MKVYSANKAKEWDAKFWNISELHGDGYWLLILEMKKREGDRILDINFRCKRDNYEGVMKISSFKLYVRFNVQ